MILRKQIFFMYLMMMSMSSSLSCKVDELAIMLVRIVEKMETVDAEGADFWDYMKANKATALLDEFEEKFSAAFSKNELKRKELLALYQKREATMTNVVAYVKDTLATMDKSVKNELVVFARKHEATLTNFLVTVKGIIEEFVHEFETMRSEISAYRSDATHEKDIADAKIEISKVLDERYETWSKMLERIAIVEWKYAVILELSK